MLQTQHNMWIHLFAAFMVLGMGLCLSITRMEWVALVVAISLVWITETLNTAIEFLGDAVSLEKNALIARSKDVAAGAVLFATIASVIIGLLVFLPYLT